MNIGNTIYSDELIILQTLADVIIIPQCTVLLRVECAISFTPSYHRHRPLHSNPGRRDEH